MNVRLCFPAFVYILFYVLSINQSINTSHPSIQAHIGLRKDVKVGELLPENLAPPVAGEEVDEPSPRFRRMTNHVEGEEYPDNQLGFVDLKYRSPGWLSDVS